MAVGACVIVDDVPDKVADSEVGCAETETMKNDSKKMAESIQS